MKFAAQRSCDWPRPPSPIGWPSMLTTGITIWLADVLKASRAA